MTNQDIANIYNVSFQKIQQLIKKYGLNQEELRKVNNYIVYEHWLKGEVVYIGIGVWYRCRRYILWNLENLNIVLWVNTKKRPITGSDTFFHATIATLSNIDIVLNGAFKLGFIIIITSTTVNIRVVFIVVNSESC